MRVMTAIRMSPSCDLVSISFEDAVKLLSPDRPIVLVCSPYSCDEEFARWLWDNSRITSICFAPKEILKYENSWAIYGYDSYVYSEGF